MKHSPPAMGARLRRTILVTLCTMLPTTAASGQLGDCPGMSEFPLTQARIITMPVRRPDVWGAVQAALNEWQAAHFADSVAPKSGGLRPPSSAILSFDEPQASGATHASTCYLQRRIAPGIDFRIAFLLTMVKSAAGSSRPTVELRWISAIKGAGERTWQADQRWSAMFVTDLVARIRSAEVRVGP